jgi:hypothetical protein
MKLQQILEILINKSVRLSQARTAAVNSGDLPEVTRIDEELAVTNESIHQLASLLGTAQ